jgi:hypothetical protein
MMHSCPWWCICVQIVQFGVLAPPDRVTPAASFGLHASRWAHSSSVRKPGLTGWRGSADLSDCDPGTATGLHRLRDEGWLDWHILIGDVDELEPRSRQARRGLVTREMLAELRTLFEEIKIGKEGNGAGER